MDTHLELVEKDNYRMYAAIRRVRELHKSYEDFGEQWCEHCMTGQWDVELVKYPCQTIKALDGLDD